MKRWIITGGARGLGHVIAEAALARGDAVCGTVRNAAAQTAFEALAPGRSHAVICDMSDDAAVRSAVSAAINALGGADVLVNNAGYGLVGAVEEASVEEIRSQFAVNVFGPFAAIQAVLPTLRAQGSGRIINISSVSGVATWAGTGVYCASKHALEGLTQTLADEIAPFGVKVVNLQPGGIRTDFAGASMTLARRRIAEYGSPARDAETILAGHAGHEPNDPARIASVVLMVADHENPPRELLLGADALHYATQKMADRQAAIGVWAPVTLSTACQA